jgi:hypothetical protein
MTHLSSRTFDFATLATANLGFCAKIETLFSILAAKGNEMHSTVKKLVVLPASFYKACAWSMLLKYKICNPMAA